MNSDLTKLGKTKKTNNKNLINSNLTLDVSFKSFLLSRQVESRFTLQQTDFEGRNL